MGEIKDTSNETKNESVDDPCKDCKTVRELSLNYLNHLSNYLLNPERSPFSLTIHPNIYCSCCCPHRPQIKNYPLIEENSSFVEDVKKFINFISKIFTKKDTNLKKIEKGV